MIAAAVVAFAFVLAWLLEERPLRKTIEESDVGDAFAAPQGTDSLEEITRELSRLVGRERTRRFIERVIEEAEVDLTPAEAWLLGRAREGAIPVECLEAGDADAESRLRAGAEGLRERGLVAEGDGPALLLTEPGLVAHDRIVAERHRCLGTLVADWECGEPEVDAMIERLSEELGRLQPLSS